MANCFKGMQEMEIMRLKASINKSLSIMPFDQQALLISQCDTLSHQHTLEMAIKGVETSAKQLEQWKALYSKASQVAAKYKPS
jgi:hypothetical protein